MALRPICEPVELPLGASVLAERVAIGADAPTIGRFTHFHDVAELVLFGRVRGEFIADGRRHRLSDGAVVFVPSMRHHDFALERGDMDWVLVQVDPYLVEALALKPMLARLTRPFCAWPVGPAHERVAMLGDWLVEAAAGRMADASVVRIVELLLLAASEAPEREAAQDEVSVSSIERLVPVLERIRAAPAEPITLGAAAAICSLSPAYFSRRFSQAFGMAFTEYVRIHRLHLAARRIATSGAAISSVAYDLGFSSPSYFTARFRERFAMTPREYRASARSRASA
jgi:AraC-like DNA-binding protein